MTDIQVQVGEHDGFRAIGVAFRKGIGMLSGAIG